MNGSKLAAEFVERFTREGDLMEQITAIADQFFALPYISSFRVMRCCGSSNSYGTPLFLIFAR